MKRGIKTEYEATFPDIDGQDIRRRLKAAGARLAKPDFLQKRSVWLLPTGHRIRGGWLRVRDESDRVTMSLKIVSGGRISDQKEICLVVDDFKEAELFLETLGCRKKAFQESRREIWRIGGTEFCVDEWPFLEPFLEIEDKSERAVRAAAAKLGLDYRQAYFGAVDGLYERKYGVRKNIINNRTPDIRFGGTNPFQKKG